MAEDKGTTAGMPQGSLWSLRLLGVPIRLHFTFVLLLVFLIVTGLGGSQSMSYYAVYLIALFASVLLHELGHAWAGSRYGIRTIEVVMFPIGGVSRMERDPKPKEELWIALAGPLVNLALAAALFALLYYRHAIVGLRDLLQP